MCFSDGTENVNDEEFTDRAGVTHWITTKKSLYVSVTGEQFIVGCIRDQTELRRGQRELQHARDHLEDLVRARTAELAATNEALLQQIAENERTSDQLRQSQKMEAMGRLAGGIAHDFNNLLNVIIGYSSLSEAQALPGSPLHEHAAQVRTAAERAASLTHQLLAFSRKQMLKPELLDLNSVLASMGKMLRAFIREDIELEIMSGANSTCIKADRGQIEQVVMNLVANARDAMPHGGKLTLRTGSAHLTSQMDGEDCVEDREYVVLQVSDTGHGMDATTQAQIFEPFFTTKTEGKGTGLGLATVYGIVKQSGGHVRVSSQTGQGTVVTVYLPQAAERAPVSRPTLVTKPRQGSETILLVEDQESLRTLLHRVLESSGYKVLTAGTGAEALRTADRYDRHIDLLVTDVVMPGMRGWQLARKLLCKRPEIKILYMSGYSDIDLVAEGRFQSGAALLEKPFRPEALLNKVRDALDMPQIPVAPSKRRRTRQPRAASM
ncbi:MAG TPA: ATP-binding protein [Terriglobales bacterium]|nr:ATP-binding protein [Terriglobales bacterium]